MQFSKIRKKEKDFSKEKDSLIYTAEFFEKVNRYLNQERSVNQIILEFQNVFNKGKNCFAIF